MKIHHEVDPLPLRKAAYMPIGDQLDAIMKALAQLGSQGFQLPPETVMWIEHCQQVKEKYKKP
jgi:hypothetical protein